MTLAQRKCPQAGIAGSPIGNVDGCYAVGEWEFGCVVLPDIGVLYRDAGENFTIHLCFDLESPVCIAAHGKCDFIDTLAGKIFKK